MSRDKKYAAEVGDELKSLYPDGECMLKYEGEPWRLLCMAILSAQCTDARVNEVTPGLFAKYGSVEAFAEAPISELEQDIRSTGFYHNKAKNIKACARKLLDEYGGIVPSDIEELVKLPGVGRKTANVIRGNIFQIPSVVVDTHVGRLSRRLGLTEAEDPEKVEYDLMACIPEDHWILINLDLIALGRSICKSQKPRCGECFLADICPYGEEKEKIHV